MYALVDSRKKQCLANTATAKIAPAGCERIRPHKNANRGSSKLAPWALASLDENRIPPGLDKSSSCHAQALSTNLCMYVLRACICHPNLHPSSVLSPRILTPANRHRARSLVFVCVDCSARGCGGSLFVQPTRNTEKRTGKSREKLALKKKTRHTKGDPRCRIRPNLLNLTGL